MNFRTARGFTLIELMISIALVLLLMLGVNQVFEYTTKAVSQGEAINAAIRSSRAAQATFANDFASMVSPGNGPNDSGALIISSQQAFAYRNKADLAAEGNYSNASASITSVNGASIPPGAQYQDFAGSGNFGDPNVAGDVTYPYNYNNRNHRLDVLSFFARDLFHRQTGNPGTFVANEAATEAWVWYGHLQLPDNGGYDTNIDFPHTQGSADTFPCAGAPATNPNNCFGNQLVLGRMATLLIPKNTTTGSPYYNEIVDSSYTPQWFLDYNGNALDPLGAYTKVNQAAVYSPTDSATYHLPDSRVDLASTSIAGFKTTLSNAILTGGASFNWWDLMMDGNPAYINNTQYTRFKCNPFVPKPMQAVNMAFANPYFLAGCSQFTVEFAGDYLKQDLNPGDVKGTGGSLYSYGDVESVAADGQTDFQIVSTVVNGVTYTRKQIIWYGLPRNTSGVLNSGGTTGSIATGTNNGSPTLPNGDVAPVAYWTHNAQSFEKMLPGASGSTVTTATTYSGYPSGTMSNGDRYVCAWGPNDLNSLGKSSKPTLIRITITLDDPTGRLADGLTYQYVFGVP